MGLIRLFLYDRPLSIPRFVVELGVLVIVIALAASFFAAKTLIMLQQWLR